MPSNSGSVWTSTTERRLNPWPRRGDTLQDVEDKGGHLREPSKGLEGDARDLNDTDRATYEKVLEDCLKKPKKIPPSAKHKLNYDLMGTQPFHNELADVNEGVSDTKSIIWWFQTHNSWASRSPGCYRSSHSRRQAI